MGNIVKKKIKSFDGTELYYKENFKEGMKAIIIIVHGLCEHLGRYEYVTQKFNELGYGVVRFDNRGHGKSGGERGYVKNFMDFLYDTNEVVKFCKSKHKNIPIFMLGHSMGGFIVASYGSKYKGEVTGQILSGAAVIDLPVFEELKNSKEFEKNPLEKAPNSLSNLICRDEKVVLEYEKDPLVLKETTLKLLGEVFVKGVQWLKNNIKSYEYPCLILHGEDDKIVINKASKWMYSNISSNDKTLKIYEKCYHEILNEVEEKDIVIEDINKWIQEKIK